MHLYSKPELHDAVTHQVRQRLHEARSVKIMHRATVLLLGFLILGCGPKDGSRVESVLPTVDSTAAPQRTPSPEPRPECQNVAGVLGFADISFDASTVLQFFEKPDASGKPAQTLRFYDDPAINSYSFRAEGEKSYPALRPGAHKLDYDLFELAVVNRRGGWLEVVVSEKKDETLWLKEDKLVRFKDWLQGMKDAFAVARIKSTINPLRAAPSANAKEVSFSGRDCFKVVQMKGDWIKVSLQDHYCSGTPEPNVSGWLRWRDENGCLLVEIFPFA